MEIKKLVIQLPVDLHKDFKLICWQKDTSMKDVITQFVEDYVRANKKTA